MPLVELRDVRKIYQVAGEEVRALDGIDLDIERGEFISIVGPSGSGKSTLMHLLGCLDIPTSGTMKLDGADVSKATPNELARLRNQEIGFVFQAFNLLPRLNVLENVELPMIYGSVSAAERHRRASLALEQVDLSPRAKHLPSELSGGQSQRVAIARALVNDPKIIFADEPTGNLDTVTGKAIMEVFRKLAREGKTIVLVTHDLNISSQTNRRIEIRDGKIVPSSVTASV
jgi:putative ABC transport system ATP-binding protein